MKGLYLMSTNVLNVGVNGQVTNFKGKYKQTADGSKYYSTNSAAIAGGVLAVPAFILQIVSSKGRADNLKDFLSKLKFAIGQLSAEEKKEIDKLINSEGFIKTAEDVLKGSKSNKWISASLAAALTLGSGLVVNGIRNKKAKKAAEEVAQKGPEQALYTNKKIKISDNGNLYYKSNDGKKWGALLGLGTFGTFVGANYLINKKTIKSAFKIAKDMFKSVAKDDAQIKEVLPLLKRSLKGTCAVAGIIVAGCFALGGLIMGAIADGCANLKARKNS